ncbi:MAG: M13 family metallopeptidase [Acidobacteriota bacterium]
MHFARRTHLRPYTLCLLATLCLVTAFAASAQQAAKTAVAPQSHYVPGAAFDLKAIDTKADPCTDFYKYACGNFAALHPIPADQAGVDQFYVLYNVSTEQLNGILNKYTDHAAQKSANEQKIGDYYAACMNTAAIDQKGLASNQPLLDEIDHASRLNMPSLVGKLQRIGVGVFFSFGEAQDFKDSTKQVAFIDQGGLGLPERDYYTRTGDKDNQLREKYVAFITQMLTFAGEGADQAATDAKDILAFETKLAEASMTNTERRDPMAIYHPQTLAAFEASVAPLNMKPYLEAIHSPAIDNLVNANPAFFPAMVTAARSTDMQTLKAYMRFHLLTSFAHVLPSNIDKENFKFYGTELSGQPEQRPRWKRCSSAVDGALGEALGQVYVQQYFDAGSKAKTLEMVHDIESAMDRDLDTLDWMSPATRTRAKEKLHAIADKIGYPEHWRDYTTLTVSATDPLANAEHATAFENDRQLNKIGKPVDKQEWSMSPPTINAYYDPSMNNINFPAGILQPAFYDPHADVAVNYGHIGAVIGHELTHGFDDQGAQFDATGNLSDWWTAADKANFKTKTGCLVNEYGSFVAVEDEKNPAANVKVNGQLTLGENTADNGGLVLAYMAYLARAKAQGIDINKKIDGFTGPQRFYIAYAQNWCENSRPDSIREQVLTDPHSPDHFRANGAIVNQPNFAPAFGCKAGSPMAPAKNCRVW